MQVAYSRVMPAYCRFGKLLYSSVLACRGPGRGNFFERGAASRNAVPAQHHLCQYGNAMKFVH